MTIIKASETTLVLSSTKTVVLSETGTSKVIVNQDLDRRLIPKEEREVFFVGAPGPQGPPGGVGQIQFNTKVEVGNTEIIDSVSVSLVDHSFWLVLVRDPALNQRKTFHVSANHSSGVPTHQIPVIVGASTIAAFSDIDVVIESGNLNIKLTNNHTNDLTVEVIRIKIDTVTL